MSLEKGWSKAGLVTCPACGGEGYTQTTVNGSDYKQVLKKQCSTCKGTGQVRSKK